MHVQVIRYIGTGDNSGVKTGPLGPRSVALTKPLDICTYIQHMASPGTMYNMYIKR